MAEETGSKDDPTAEPTAKSADSSRSGDAPSRKTRSTKKKTSTTSTRKTAGTSRARAGKASATTARRKAAKRPAAGKTSGTTSSAAAKTAETQATSDHSSASAAQTDSPEAGARGRDEFWRALGIIGFSTVSVGLIGLATLGGLVQSVMRVSRPRETPPLTGFQKCVAAYLRQIVDYLAAPDTTADPPFPFSDFPGDASSAEPKRDSNA